MEGTSGAADPDLLRGSSGEAALGPRVAVPAQAEHSRSCQWDLRDLRKQIAALCLAGLPASRERVARGVT